MAGPWEKYGSAPAADDGPWAKYGGEAVAADPAPAPEGPSKLRSFAEGALTGAAGIGNTLLAPVKAGAKLVGADGVGDYLDRIPEAMSGLARDNAENPWSFGAGKLGAEVAMTAPVGGVIGGGLAKVAPMLGRAAPIVNKLAQATSSGGMKLGGPAATTALGRAGDMGLRMAGGAINGAATAGLVDPSSAGTGALIGAAIPGGVALAGKSGRILKGMWAKASAGDAAAADDLAKALGLMTPEQRSAAVQQLRSAENMVGESPTVAQVLQTPEASITQRVVYDSPGGNSLRNKIANQNQARLGALESVAPTMATGRAEAMNDLGNAITSRVIPEEQAIGEKISAQYNGVDPQGAAKIKIPIDEFLASLNKYLGKGSFGQGADASQAISEAQSLAKGPLESVTRNQLMPGKGAAKWAIQSVESKVPGEALATWRETQSLRSSLGTAINKAGLAGNKEEKAALTGMLSALDSKIEALSTGAGSAGENFTPQMAAAWKKANASFANKMGRFHTGPQAAIFRKGSDGAPLLQGGEVAAKFWGARPGAADDVKAFRRLVDDNPAMLGQFRSMVTTEGAGTADAAGNLTTKFSKWVKQTLPGLREAFEPAEVERLQKIAADIDRHYSAVKLGTSLGGSNTYQNSANALSLGLLDNPALDKAAGMIPGIRLAASPALEALRASARNSKATKLSNLLSDNTAAANALANAFKASSSNRLAPAEVSELTKLLARSAPVALTPSGRQ